MPHSLVSETRSTVKQVTVIPTCPDQKKGTFCFLQWGEENPKGEGGNSLSRKVNQPEKGFPKKEKAHLRVGKKACNLELNLTKGNFLKKTQGSRVVHECKQKKYGKTEGAGWGKSFLL